MITLNKISKSYSDNSVLDNITVDIPDRAITGIIGPNGAGKSTLIKIITGVETSKSGSVYIDGKKVKSFNQTKNLISYLPEKMVLYPEYFTDDFLDFYHNFINYKDDDLLQAFSLKEIYHKKIKHLSKGWHQRLKLYIALCNKKNIVFLDEPFEGFDPLQMRDIAKIIRLQNNKGREFILSIHQLNYAQKICDYFIFLNKGKLIETGSFKTLKEKYSIADDDLEEILLKIIKK